MNARKAPGAVRVGIGGWTYAPWRGGTFYPKGLVQRRELEYASRQLTAIEINGTYYRAQSRQTYARWRDEVPDGFVFAAKAPMRIVKARDLSKVGGQVEGFIEGIAELGDRLGPLLWQFDGGPSLQRDVFADFVAALPTDVDGRALRHVLDVRDPGFVDDAYVQLARRHGIAIVCTDSTEHPNLADVTADFVYARLMRSRAAIGKGYPDDELDAWAGRTRTWAQGGMPSDLPVLASRAPERPREVFVFFIGAAKQRNPAAAVALQARLDAG
ncbi:DUF72 domain-containing protein [Lysobacter sp. A3-1-A15]|uniref:DUF72 domain-containing protein n=1 Tax=Novilysobacter viscosus TaxID=3098602 RepID=UPI002EDB574B